MPRVIEKRTLIRVHCRYQIYTHVLKVIISCFRLEPRVHQTNGKGYFRILGIELEVRVEEYQMNFLHSKDCPH